MERGESFLTLVDSRSNITKSLDTLSLSSLSSTSLNESFYRVYKERWAGLIVIVLLNISSTFNWLTFSPIPNISTNYFNVSLTTINMLSLEYMVVFIFVSFLSTPIIEKYGITRGLLIGALFNAIGTWVRFSATYFDEASKRFAIVAVGQTICAIADPFFITIPVMYAMTWFNESGRTTATMIATISLPLGEAFASISIPYFVSEQKDLKYLLLLTSIGATALVFSTFFIREKPSTPPTFTASQTPEDFLPGFKKLVKNWNFWKLLLGFSISNGFMIALAQLGSGLLTAFEYTETEAGWLTGSMFIASLVGAGLISPLVDKFHIHHFALKTSVPLTAGLLFSLIFLVRPNNFLLLAIVCGAIGFLHLGVKPVFLELAVECTYPLSANISSSVLWMASSLVEIGFTIAMDQLREPVKEKRGLWFEGVVSLVFAVLILFYNSKKLRLEAENIHPSFHNVINVLEKRDDDP
ncbi:hypothetical protein G9A89_007887 [Geosiphon pyriformis]|nr:hypothetical protein G9A89_007887 [Geosiphon pyriformis]